MGCSYSTVTYFTNISGVGCGQSDVGSGREEATVGGGVGSGGVGGDGPRLNLPHLQDLIGKEALQYRPGARLSQVLATL